MNVLLLAACVERTTITAILLPDAKPYERAAACWLLAATKQCERAVAVRRAIIAISIAIGVLIDVIFVILFNEILLFWSGFVAQSPRLLLVSL